MITTTITIFTIALALTTALTLALPWLVVEWANREADLDDRRN